MGVTFLVKSAKSHTEAIMCMLQIVMYAVVEKRMENKSKLR